MQDVARTELAHPVVRLEVPSRSRIRNRIDCERLIVALVPDDRLDDRRSFIRGILFPLAALGRRAFHERPDLRENTTAESELARIRINLVDVAAVVTTLDRHSGDQRRQRVIFCSHVREPIVLSNVCIGLQDALEYRCAGNDREYRLVRGLIQPGHEIAAFAVEIHVYIVQKSLRKNRSGNHAGITSTSTIYRTCVLKHDLMSRETNVFRSVAISPDPLRNVGEAGGDLGKHLRVLPIELNVSDTEVIGIDRHVLRRVRPSRLTECCRVSRR